MFEVPTDFSTRVLEVALRNLISRHDALRAKLDAFRARQTEVARAMTHDLTLDAKA